MMKIEQLKKMPVGQKIGGGFILTVKKTKKAVRLPNKNYIHTVVLFDNTGEILADFKDPGGAGAYNPMIKAQEVKIIVAEIQHAEIGTKLYVDQFALITSQPPETNYAPGDDYPDWRTTVRGKIRHGQVCSALKGLLAQGKTLEEAADEILAHKTKIENLAEYVMTGE